MFSFRLNTLSLIQGFIFSFPSRVCVYSCRACLFVFFHFVLAWVSLPRFLLFWVWVISQFEASLFFPLTAKLGFEKLFCFFVSVHAFCSLKMYKQTGQLSYSKWCTGCWLVMARRCGLAGFCSWDLVKVLLSGFSLPVWGHSLRHHGQYFVAWISLHTSGAFTSF